MTFTPTITEDSSTSPKSYTMTWTNDGEKDNPAAVTWHDGAGGSGGATYIQSDAAASITSFYTGVSLNNARSPMLIGVSAIIKLLSGSSYYYTTAIIYHGGAYGAIPRPMSLPANFITNASSTSATNRDVVPAIISIVPNAGSESSPAVYGIRGAVPSSVASKITIDSAYAVPLRGLSLSTGASHADMTITGARGVSASIFACTIPDAAAYGEADVTIVSTTGDTYTLLHVNHDIQWGGRNAGFCGPYAAADVPQRAYLEGWLLVDGSLKRATLCIIPTSPTLLTTAGGCYLSYVDGATISTIDLGAGATVTVPGTIYTCYSVESGAVK